MTNGREKKNKKVDRKRSIDERNSREGSFREEERRLNAEIGQKGNKTG